MYAALPDLTLTPAAIQEAAATLAERRRQGLQGPVLTDACRPRTLGDALAIQGAVAGLLGDEIAGWKCGTPAPDKQVVAPIFARTVHRASPCPVWSRAGQVRVEPELAFVLQSDLPVRQQPWQPEEVDAAIGATHLALELLDSRYDTAGEGTQAPAFADKLADGLVNQGLFLGPEVDGDAARQTAEMAIGVSLGEQAETLRPGKHPDPLPRLPLYWLAEFLRQQGVALRAGQVLITGSYAGSVHLPVGEPIAVRHGDLGRFSLRFQAR